MNTKHVGLLNIPMGLAGRHGGAALGPQALRQAGLNAELENLGLKIHELGTIHIPAREISEDNSSDLEGQAHFLETVRKVSSDVMKNFQSNNTFPIALGGDHSISLGTVAAASQGERIGLIWLDAHPDFNTPKTTLSGNIHGMPVAHLIGLGSSRLRSIWPFDQAVHPEDVVMLAIRSIDPEERKLLNKHGIKVYTMREIDRLGIAWIAEKILERLGDLSKIHLSFDADALDPSIAPGVGTPEPGGLTFREARLLMEILAESKRITSLDLVEVNPLLDIRNQTAKAMVDLTAFLLGKTYF